MGLACAAPRFEVGLLPSFWKHSRFLLKGVILCVKYMSLLWGGVGGETKSSPKLCEFKVGASLCILDVRRGLISDCSGKSFSRFNSYCKGQEDQSNL